VDSCDGAFQGVPTVFCALHMLAPNTTLVGVKVDFLLMYMAFMVRNFLLYDVSLGVFVLPK
jgi:hypothetical protein